jgi:vitamin B12 transporter
MRSQFRLAGALPALVLPFATMAQTLPEPPVALAGIVISASRIATETARTGSSVSLLTTENLATDGRPFVLQQLRDLPGVTIQQNGPPGTVSGFAIRGAPQQYVRVQVEGIEISDPTAPQVTPSLSGLLVDDIGRVEVLRGSQSALYGGQAVGGVISITGPRPERDGLGNSLRLEGGAFGTVRGAYSLTGRDERGEFSLTAAHLQTDGFSAAEEADGNREDDGYETTRLSGSARYYLTEQSDVFVSGFWQDEDGDFDNGPGPGQDAANTFDARQWGARGGLAFTTEAGFENTVTVSHFDIDRTQRNAFGPFSTRGDRTRAEYLGAFMPSDDLRLQYGADYAYETARSNFSPEESAWIAGAFVQSNWSPREALVIDASARIDEHSEFGSYPTGRLTAAWLPQADTTIRGSLGTGFRAPSIFELYDAFSGNAGLDPETSVSADLGVTRRFAEGRGEASATAFWLEIDDLIEFDTTTNVFFQRNGTATSRGVEIAGRWEFAEALAVSGSYTYTDAELPGGARRDRIPRHDLALALTGTVAERLRYDLGATLVRDFVDDSARDFSGAVIESRGFAEDYVVVNARLGYALTDTVEAYVRAENLFDEQYQTARGYSTSDRAFYAGLTARF